MKVQTHKARYLCLAVLSFACIGAGFARAEWKNLTEQENEALPGDQIQLIKEIDGVVWIGGMEGLTRYKDGEFTAVTETVEKKKRGEVEEIERPISSQAWDVHKVGENSLLLGHSKGVTLLEGAAIKNHEMKGYTASPVVQGHNGVVWTLAKKEENKQQVTNIMQRGEGGKWTVIEYFKKDKDSDKKRIVEDLYADSSGQFWVTISGNGVINADPAKKPEKWEHYLKGYNVTTVGEDAQGRVWCGLWERGVAMLQNGSMRRHLSDEDMIPLTIVGTEESVWVATNDRGCFQKVGDEWKQHFADEGAVNLLETTSDGRVWVSSQKKGGLKVWTGEEWKVALPGPSPIRAVTLTSDNTIWAGGILDGLHILEE